MKVIRNLNQIKTSLPDLVLTIGNFDGVHLGHLEIIQKIKKIAQEKKLTSAILTFEPHPITFLRPERATDFRISSLAQKLKLFKESKIDFVIVLPFDQKLANISPENFIKDILVKRLNTKHLVIGYDFIFGKNREGNFRLLEQESKNYGFILDEISAVKKENYTCSSTIIRKLISEGNILQANQILGRNFAISGLVCNGQKLASQLGFPTMNIKLKPNIIKPKFGVYKTEVFIPFLQKRFSSITNFGIKPTIDSKDLVPIFETHIPNFSKELYGKKIIVEFIDFIRPEQKFSSLNDLKNQIQKDIEKINL